MAGTNRTNAIFVYKLTTDNGGAPCVYRRVLSLCICKPRIRQQAEVGDWIIGLGAKGAPEMNGRLIYIAKVTRKLSEGDYYQDIVYKNRPDCIYEKVKGEFRWREGSHYHSPDDLVHDLGTSTEYGRAVSLVSNEFVYFGNNASPSIDPIQQIYDQLPRDYKVNHDTQVQGALLEYIDAILKEYGFGKHGQPTHLEKSRKCNRDDDGLIKVPSCYCS